MSAGSHRPCRGRPRVAPENGHPKWKAVDLNFPLTAWAVAVAAAAAVALVSAPRSTQSPAGVDSNRFGHETSALESGGDSTPRNAAESGAEPLSYHRAGVVSFTLSPESRVEMVASEGAGSMTVTLIRGTIHADVTPRPDGEVFAVEVGHTRVAAHGTSFTVSRAERESGSGPGQSPGAVAGTFGPVGHPGSTQGWLVVGSIARCSRSTVRERSEVARSARAAAGESPGCPTLHARNRNRSFRPSNRAAAIEPSSASKAAPLVATAPVAPKKSPPHPKRRARWCANRMPPPPS